MQIQKTDYPKLGETLCSAVLPNGLRLRIVPKRGFSTSCAVFAANYGGAHRRFAVDGKTIDTPAGVAHFLEHKMFDMPGGENALNILSANGADPNAFTSSGMTCYYFNCTQSFEENLRMLLRFVSTPYFTEETVQKEQGIIAQEIVMGEDSPGNAVYYNLLSLLYKHHPIKDKVAGTVESIAQITHETLYDCHRVFYSPCNMSLCIEGDVDPEEICRIAMEELPAEKGTPPTADFGPEEELLPLESFKSVEMAVSAPQFLIGAKLRHAVGGEEILRQRVLSQLSMRLLAGSSSPFYAGLYAEGLLSHDFDYEVDFSAGTATVILGGESKDPQKVLDRLKAEVERIRLEGLDPQRFERAKRASLGARLRGLEDFENVCVSMAVSVFDGYCAFDALPVLDSIGIEECRAFIVEALSPERLAMSVVIPGKV